MNRFSKVIIFLLSSVLVIAYTNCSNEFQISQIDNFEESEHSVQDTSDDYIEPISPVVVDLPPAKPVSPSYKDVFIENPDWSFTDNFEGTKDTSFWNGGTKTSHSVSCQSSPDWDSKVLQFN